jgi:hypothetical protein
MPKAQITEAEISRAIRAAKKVGETVYGYTVGGGNVTVHITPMTGIGGDVEKSNADKWFENGND